MLSFFSRWITANDLTVMRILLVPVIFVVMVFWQNNPWVLFGIWFVFLFACLTDYWDGVLARYQNKSTKLGMLLDPIADKILIMSLLIVLVGLNRAPDYLVAILITREFAVTGLRAVAASEGRVIAANSGGKYKTLSQMFAVGFLIIHYPTFGIPTHETGILLLWLATGISLWSGFYYFRAYYSTLPDPGSESSNSSGQ
ncbi:MAG: CDP-diacylglycerol--glycerol-3-phosphate 3-phosphatidyltransferase [bacterium]